MVASLQYSSPDAQRKQLERQVELNATLAAKQAAKQQLQRSLPMPAQGATPPGPSAGALPLPGGMASPSSMGMAPPPSMGAAAPSPMAPPMAMPPSGPSPMAGPSTREAPFGPDVPPATAAPQGFAEGGMVDAPVKPPRVISAGEILSLIARQANGEQLDPQAALSELDTAAMAPDTVAPAPEADLPPPPRAFIDWLEQTDPATTTEFGKILIETYTANPEQVAMLWDLVKEFASAPDDGGSDELPPEVLRMAGARRKAPAKKPPMPTPGETPLPLPA